MMTYFQRNTFLFTAWCKMLLNVFLHYYVTAESYLHYNKGIFYKMVPVYKMLNLAPGMIY